ncbi:MAG: DUF5060 domain-containing protein [Hellea sp.]
MRAYLIAVLALLFTGCGGLPDFPMAPVTIDGDLKVWNPISLSFEGQIFSEEENTFRDYELNVYFEHEDGGIIAVPGYFAADGKAEFSGAESGNIWRAHFVPSRSGKWFYSAYLKTGDNMVAKPPIIQGFSPIDGTEGEFIVDDAELDSSATDFRKQGMLQDVNARYLQFSGTKEYFLKTGAGSPENILAYSDFDGTYDVGGTHFPALGENQLHEFEPHLKDAREGDPTWGGDEGKGAAILGIANYYEEVGVNAQYLVTMNVEGDGQDVFPWVSHNDPYVFDVSKLAQWQRVFEHFNSRGVLIDMLLTETENESWFEAMDGVEVGKDFAESRKLYYREIVARFGHLNGLVFNLGEENGVVGNSGQDPYRQPTSLEQRRAFAKYIRDLDPYDHAVVSHNWPDSEEETYGALLGDPDFSGISLQAHDKYFEKIATWTQKSKAAGRQWMVTVDEPLGWEFGARPDSENPLHEREIKEVLWPTLMAGGAGVDWYFGWQNNAATSDLSNEDQRSRHNLWVKSAKVRKFWEEHVRFWEMDSVRSSEGMAFRKPDDDHTGLVLIGDSVIYKATLQHGEKVNFRVDLDTADFDR